MNKNAWWAWAIKNIVCLIIWCALAVIFNKWWIALFGLFCISTLEAKDIKKYYRICDKCGKHSPYEDSYNDALDKAKAAGWVHCVDGNKDYCPECQAKGLGD